MTFLVKRWNETVSPDDEVYHLGDFAHDITRDLAGLLARLNGRVHLVLGNNELAPLAEATRPLRLDLRRCRSWTVGGQRIFLCHYPGARMAERLARRLAPLPATCTGNSTGSRWGSASTSGSTAMRSAPIAINRVAELLRARAPAAA